MQNLRKFLKNALFGNGAAHDVSDVQAILTVFAGLIFASLPTAFFWALGTLYKAVH